MNTNVYIRPLTHIMISKLAACWKNQKENNSPCPPRHFSTSLPGLYKRKFVDVKETVVNGKEVMCVYVTPLGVAYLQSLNLD